MQADLEKHERLKYELRISGSSLAEISRELGLTQTSVSTVCQGYRRSHRIQTAIELP
jgi:lambda repressor-like predicted transcriptional regulator